MIMQIFYVSLGVVLVSIILKIIYDYLSIDPENIYCNDIHVVFDENNDDEKSLCIECRKGWFATYKLQKTQGEGHCWKRDVVYFRNVNEAVAYAQKIYTKYMNSKKPKNKRVWKKQFKLYNNDIYDDN